MPNLFSIDHAVLLVPDLISGSELFSRLGFTVTPGGVHAGGLTHNVLIPFQDGSYLELLAAVRPASLDLLRFLRILRLLRFHPAGKTSLTRRFIDHLLIDPGICDYALACNELDQAVDQAATRGMTLDGPYPGGRVRPDGQQVSWRTATPLRFDLPFLIDDLTPRQLRVPGGTSSRHANQLISIDGVFMVVIDLYNSRLGYSHLLALEPDREAPSGETGIVSETIRIGSSHINLVDLNSLQNAGPIRRYIGTRPGRPYALQLPTDQGESHYLVYDPVRGFELSASTPEMLIAW